MNTCILYVIFRQELTMSEEEKKTETEEATEPKPDPHEGEGEESPKTKKGAFPKRYVVAIMVFLGICVQYALRVNLSVAITAMCNPHSIEENGFTIKKVK